MKHSKPDYILLFSIGALVILGLFILSSASLIISKENFGNPYHYLQRQIIFGLGIGIPGFIIAYRINYKFWKKISFPLLLFSLLLLIMVFIPKLGLEYGGAKRWLNLGPMSFQPSEFLKLSFIIYLASWLAGKKDRMFNLKSGLIPFLFIISLISILIIAEPDIGTLALIVLLGLTIYFVSGVKLSHIAAVSVLGIGAFYGLVKIAPYRLARILIFLNPNFDTQGIGYQINQAFLAIASGGLFGLGYGGSRQKFNFLPEPATDSIFAVVAEEIGFLGVIIITSLFVLFFSRGFKISLRAQDKFGALLGLGITLWIIFQAFINIGAISGLLPLTGITLPFISYGSSSLAMTLVGAGMLLNISKHSA